MKNRNLPPITGCNLGFQAETGYSIVLPMSSKELRPGDHLSRLGGTLDQRFRPHWKNYVLQSGMAGVAVFVALVVLRQQNLVVAASLAATAFTVFAMPGSVTASARNVIGGHIIGLLMGGFFALLAADFAAERDGFYALAVGCSMFVMTITNTEHPPAAGTALGVVIAGFSWRVALGVIAGIILSAIHAAMRAALRDLVLPPENARKDR